MWPYSAHRPAPSTATLSLSVGTIFLHKLWACRRQSVTPTRAYLCSRCIGPSFALTSMGTADREFAGSVTTIHKDVLTGDKRRLIRSEEQHHVGDLFRAREPIERYHRQKSFNVFRFRSVTGDRGNIGQAGTDAVDGDIVLTQFQCHHLCQHHDGSFGSAVGGRL